MSITAKEFDERFEKEDINEYNAPKISDSEFSIDLSA